MTDPTMMIVPPGLMTALGECFTQMTALAIQAYATKFPAAGAGLVHELKAGELRCYVIGSFGGGAPLEVSVQVPTGDAAVPMLELAHIVVPLPAE